MTDSTASPTANELSLATAPTTSGANRGRSILRRIAGLLLLTLTTIGILTVGMTGAGAQVNSGLGATAYTVTRCQLNVGGLAAASITAHVGQEVNGQSVAARIWIQDSRGWHHTDWAVKSNPGWNYDGAVWFTATFSGLTGHVTYVYVEYGWYRSSGWVTGAEPIRTYSDQWGNQMSYCQV